MSDNKFKWLQFFADGAAGGDGGGDGAGAGVTAADAGRATGDVAGDADRRLEELRIPPDKAERFKKAQKRISKAAAPTQESKQGEPAGPSWDDFMAIPENQQRLQSMMAERGKKATEATQAAQAQIEKLNPALRLLAEKYGIEAKDGKYDLDAITKAVTEDDSYYEDKAMELGVSTEVARQLERASQIEEREQAEQAEQQRRQELQEHFMKMQQQSDALRQIFPDFNLDQALQDPVFHQRTAPRKYGGGEMSVEDAFYSIHHKDIMQQQAEAIAKRAKVDAASAIRSGVRPKENGSGSVAPAAATPDYHAMFKNMTREQRLAYIKAIPPPR